MTTNNHPAQGPVSLDRLHQIREILSKASAQSDGGNLGYAMADAVKVINVAIAVFGAEPVAEIREDLGRLFVKINQPSILKAGDRLYTILPAQLVNTIDETLIESLRLVQCMLDDYRERNYGHAQEWIRHISAKMEDYSEQHGDDAYSVISAAMLQSFSNSEQLIKHPSSNQDSDGKALVEEIKQSSNNCTIGVQAFEALPVIGWLRSDYNSDDKRDPNAPLFMLGSNDPSETWGVKYIPLSGNSPETLDSLCPCCGRKPLKHIKCSVPGCGRKHVAHGVCQRHYDMKRREDPEQVEKFREANRRFTAKKRAQKAAEPQREVIIANRPG